MTTISPSGATFEDLRTSGLGGILGKVLDASSADADTTRTAQALLGRLPALTNVMDSYLSGVAIDAAHVHEVLDTATAAALVLVGALTETAGLIEGTPGTVVVRHFDHLRPEPALAIGPQTRRMFP